ncbi:MAG: hypothetical protein ACR2PT_17835 [Endozoicomonas sp.]
MPTEQFTCLGCKQGTQGSSTGIYNSGSSQGACAIDPDEASRTLKKISLGGGRRSWLFTGDGDISWGTNDANSWGCDLSPEPDSPDCIIVEQESHEQVEQNAFQDILSELASQDISIIYMFNTAAQSIVQTIRAIANSITQSEEDSQKVLSRGLQKKKYSEVPVEEGLFYYPSLALLASYIANLGETEVPIEITLIIFEAADDNHPYYHFFSLYIFNGLIQVIFPTLNQVSYLSIPADIRAILTVINTLFKKFRADELYAYSREHKQ